VNNRCIEQWTKVTFINIFWCFRCRRHGSTPGEKNAQWVMRMFYIYTFTSPSWNWKKICSHPETVHMQKLKWICSHPETVRMLNLLACWKWQACRNWNEYVHIQRLFSHAESDKHAETEKHKLENKGPAVRIKTMHNLVWHPSDHTHVHTWRQQNKNKTHVHTGRWRTANWL